MTTVVMWDWSGIDAPVVKIEDNRESSGPADSWREKNPDRKPNGPPKGKKIDTAWLEISPRGSGHLMKRAITLNMPTSLCTSHRPTKEGERETLRNNGVK